MTPCARSSSAPGRSIRCRRLAQAHVQNRSHQRSHRNSTPGIVGLAVLDFDLRITDVFRAKPEAFLGPESTIGRMLATSKSKLGPSADSSDFAPAKYRASSSAVR